MSLSPFPTSACPHSCLRFSHHASFSSCHTHLHPPLLITHDPTRDAPPFFVSPRDTLRSDDTPAQPRALSRSSLDQRVAVVTLQNGHPRTHTKGRAHAHARCAERRRALMTTHTALRKQLSLLAPATQHRGRSAHRRTRALRPWSPARAGAGRAPRRHVTAPSRRLPPGAHPPSRAAGAIAARAHAAVRGRGRAAIADVHLVRRRHRRRVAAAARRRRARLV